MNSTCPEYYFSDIFQYQDLSLLRRISIYSSDYVTWMRSGLFKGHWHWHLQYLIFSTGQSRVGTGRISRSFSLTGFEDSGGESVAKLASNHLRINVERIAVFLDGL